MRVRVWVGQGTKRGKRIEVAKMREMVGYRAERRSIERMRPKIGIIVNNALALALALAISSPASPWDSTSTIRCGIRCWHSSTRDRRTPLQAANISLHRPRLRNTEI
jgi:hypothetical protein